MDEVIRLLQQQSHALAGQTIEIPFEAQDTSMLPDGESFDVIRISPPKVVTVFKITPLLARIDREDLEKITVDRQRNFDPRAPVIFEKYADLILEVICHGIHNGKDTFPAHLKTFLEVNCTWEDLHVLLNAILFRMGTWHFTNSTISLRAMGLMEAEDIIALQENLDSWKEKRLSALSVSS
jgi:hypothetical protein